MLQGTLDPAWRQHPPGLTAPGGQLTDAQLADRLRHEVQQRGLVFEDAADL